MDVLIIIYFFALWLVNVSQYSFAAKLTSQLSLGVCIGNQCKSSRFLGCFVCVLSSSTYMVTLSLFGWVGKVIKRFYDSMLVRSWCWCLMLIIKNLLRNFHHLYRQERKTTRLAVDYSTLDYFAHSLVNDFLRFVFPSFLDAAATSSWNLGLWMATLHQERSSQLW